MKKYVLIISLFLSTIAFSQNVKFPYDSVSNEVIYTEVIEVDLSKDQLFRNAKTFFAKNLNSYNKSVDMEDISTGRIIANIKYNNSNWESDFDHLVFTITIDCKEGRFRYKITDIMTSTYVESLDLLIENTMVDYMRATNKDALSHGLKLNNVFLNMGTLIVKEMSINDDF